MCGNPGFLGGGPATAVTRGSGPAHLTPGGQVLRVSVGSALQGDVLITSCTYNTEDRRLATVVSHPSVSPPATEHGHQSQLR